jgi:hypothetical protein
MMLLKEIFYFLDVVGVFDIILPFLIIFILSLWLFILKFGKKKINYKRGIIIYIGLIVIAGILNILSTVIPIVSFIALIYTIGLLIWMIVMYFKKKHLDVVHIYFFSIFSFIVAFLVVAISNLLSIFIEQLGTIFKLSVIAILILGLYITKRKKQ